MGISGSGANCGQTSMAQPPQAVKKDQRHTVLGNLKRQLEQIDQRKVELANAIEALEKLKYKPGDFVVHKKYGNCMILDVFIRDCGLSDNMATTASHFNTNNTDPEFGYTINSPTWEIYHPVSEEELIEYNNTTKLLYHK